MKSSFHNSPSSTSWEVGVTGLLWLFSLVAICLLTHWACSFLNSRKVEAKRLKVIRQPAFAKNKTRFVGYRFNDLTLRRLVGGPCRFVMCSDRRHKWGCYSWKWNSCHLCVSLSWMVAFLCTFLTLSANIALRNGAQLIWLLIEKNLILSKCSQPSLYLNHLLQISPIVEPFLWLSHLTVNQVCNFWGGCGLKVVSQMKKGNRRGYWCLSFVGHKISHFVLWYNNVTQQPTGLSGDLLWVCPHFS